MNAIIAETMLTQARAPGEKEVSVNRVTVPGLLVITVAVACVLGGVALGTYLTSTDSRLTSIEKDIKSIKDLLGVPGFVPPSCRGQQAIPIEHKRKG